MSEPAEPAHERLRDLRESVPETAHDAAIHGDFECSNCGYNVRGLSIGGGCPECGSVIRLPEELDLIDALPHEALATVRYGALVLAGVTGLLLAGIAFAVTVGLPFPGSSMTVLAGIWMLGAWLTTNGLPGSAAAQRALGRRSDARRFTRASQWVVVLPGLVWIAAAANVLPRGALDAMLLLVSIALVAMVMVATYLRRVSVWLDDTLAMRGLRLARNWLLLTAGLCAVGTFFRFPDLVLIIAAITGLVGQLVGMISVARSLRGWSGMAAAVDAYRRETNAS